MFPLLKTVIKERSQLYFYNWLRSFTILLFLFPMECHHKNAYWHEFRHRKVYSKTFSVSLSHTTNLPDGQWPASRRTSSRSSSLSAFSTRFHIRPRASQKRAKAQYLSLSASIMVGPSISSASCNKGRWGAVSLGSQSACLCDPSQNGLCLECPHLHRWTGFSEVSKCFPFWYTQEEPSAFGNIISWSMGGLPYTKYGPSAVILM